MRGIPADVWVRLRNLRVRTELQRLERRQIDCGVAVAELV